MVGGRSSSESPVTRPPPRSHPGTENRSPRPPRPARAPLKLDPSMGPTVVVDERGAARIQAGLVWVYRSDLQQTSEGLQGGEVVRVVDGRGWFLGTAFWSAASEIRLRVVSREDIPLDDTWMDQQLQRALDLRTRRMPGRSAYRLVHGEADGLPGVVVDRYGDHLVVQLLTQSADARRGALVSALRRLLDPACIVERSEAKVRVHEALEPVKQLLHGQIRPGLTYREGDIELGLDLWEGQKTGTFLDQVDNHVLAGSYARGRALDCFSYAGGFGLQMAKAGAQVTTIEISEPACGLIRANAERNGLSLDVVCANAFDQLRDRLDAGERFDTVVLDPPAFTKGKATLDAALRGYKEINLRALQLLEPGGTLITASCSHHVDEAAFEELLASAAADAKRTVQILERRGAPADHPVLLGLRETRYLKCFVLRVIA